MTGSNVIDFICEDCEIIELFPQSIIVDIPIKKTQQEIDNEKSGHSVKTLNFERQTIRILQSNNLYGLKVGDIVGLGYSRVCLDGKYTNIFKSLNK